MLGAVKQSPLVKAATVAEQQTSYFNMYLCKLHKLAHDEMPPGMAQKLGVSNIFITAQITLMGNTSDLLVMSSFKAVHCAQSENYLVVGNRKTKTSNGGGLHKAGHVSVAQK